MQQGGVTRSRTPCSPWGPYIVDLTLTVQEESQMTVDLVVRGGTVVDGSGSVGYRADVGIQAGRIIEIGHVAGRGAREIDADGLLVTPGFIDGHTHLDAQVNWDPYGPSAWHGVTT